MKVVQGQNNHKVGEPISDCGGVWEPGKEGNKQMQKTVMNEMKDNSENGIVISGVVAWVAMQMDMNAEGVCGWSWQRPAGPNWKLPRQRRC